MSKPAIVLKNVTKQYRLYPDNLARFMDMFGLFPRRIEALPTHLALDDMSLHINAGEKVAIIGRNGAGKSTLLKLIAKVTEPTTGDIYVKGEAKALLQIGTGFHPEFTGKENVYSYLAQLGVTGPEADRCFDEIVTFTELEEYIGQPLKTYSTGMAMRLMFATSTSISPDILILDEVLGVGDAYFTHKSHERITGLCKNNDTTLLLVSHDIYTASQLCDRMVWVDRGRILLDGPSPQVIKAYEDSIRLQEENRLRAKKSRELLAQPGSAGRQMFVEFKSLENRPLKEEIVIGGIDLYVGGSHIGTAAVTVENGFDPTTPHHLIEEGMAWGEIKEIDGKTGRLFKDHGSNFHRVSVSFDIGEIAIDRETPIRIEIDYWTGADQQAFCETHFDERSFSLGKVDLLADGAWNKVVVEATPGDVREGDKEREAGVNTAGQFGSGAVVVERIWLTQEGADTERLTHGRPMAVEMEVSVRDREFDGAVQGVVAIHRDGVTDVCRVLGQEIRFDMTAGRRQRLTVDIPRLALANGEYTVTVLIGKAGYYDNPVHRFYTINADVYCCLSRALTFTVEGMRAGRIGNRISLRGRLEGLVVNRRAKGKEGSVAANLSLMFFSIAIVLAGAEAALRSLEAGEVFQPKMVSSREGELQRVYDAYVHETEGIDRAWFLEDPSPLPHRHDPLPEHVALQKSFGGAGDWNINPLKVFNRTYAMNQYCLNGNDLFSGFAEKVNLFTPRNGGPYPPFRFLPDTSYPSGLVTNKFGWRGATIPLNKAEKTIRLAFVGASTTVSAPWFAASYPEYVCHWLDLWGKKKRLDVRFECINAGREGIDSAGIAAVALDEVLPLEPDLLLYYEGSNQFSFLTRSKSMKGFRQPPPARRGGKEKGGGSPPIRRWRGASIASLLGVRAPPPSRRNRPIA